MPDVEQRIARLLDQLDASNSSTEIDLIEKKLRVLRAQQS